jgi:hypothetical protein
MNGSFPDRLEEFQLALRMRRRAERALAMD